MASRDVELTLSVNVKWPDPEVTAMGRIVAALAPLDPATRVRVLMWAHARYVPESARSTVTVPSIYRTEPPFEWGAPDRRCLMSFGLAGTRGHPCWREPGHVPPHANPNTPFMGA